LKSNTFRVVLQVLTQLCADNYTLPPLLTEDVTHRNIGNANACFWATCPSTPAALEIPTAPITSTIFFRFDAVRSALP